MKTPWFNSKWLLFSVVVAVVASCATVHIEKRRFRKGFHVSVNSKKKSSKEAEEDNVTETKYRKDKASVKETKHLSAQELHKKSLASIDSASQEETATRNESSAKSVAEKTMSKETDQVSTLEAKSGFKKKKNERDSWLAGFLLLGGVSMALSFSKFGYQRGLWATKNPSKAQRAICNLAIAGGILSLLLGNILRVQPHVWLIVLIAKLIIIGIGISQLNRKKDKRSSKNIGVGTLFLGSFAAAFVYGGSLDTIINLDPESSGVNPGLAAFLTVVLVFALLLMGIFIVSYSCSLACGSATVLSWIVLIGGAFSLVLTLLIVEMVLWSKRKPKERIIPPALLYTYFGILTVFVIASLLGIPHI